MNTWKSIATRNNRKMTDNDFQLMRTGKYIVPRVRINQLSENPENTNIRSEKSIGDNSILCSRTARRSSLTVASSNSVLEDINESPGEEMGIGLECTPSSSSSKQIFGEYFNIPTRTTMGNRDVSVPEYNVNKKVNNFTLNTPRQIIKSRSTNTSACVSTILDGVQKKSHDTKKHAVHKGEMTNSVILVLTEGRGTAQGEIGLAAIDLKRPEMILCQLSDTQTYINTINKINILNPAEILVPKAFIQGTTLLYDTIKNQFPLCTLLTASRKYFCEKEGRHYLRNAIIPECIPVLENVLPQFFAVSAAAALLKHIEFNHNAIFSSNTLKIDYEGIEKSMFIDANTALRLELVLNTKYNTENTLYAAVNHCLTVGGRRRLRASLLQPSSDIQLIHNRQEAVEEILSNQERDFTLLKNVLHKFADVEHLFWLCTKVTKNTKHISKIQGNYTLLLKTTLEALPALMDVLKPYKSEYISNIRKTLLNSGFSKMLEIIEITINKESNREKGYAQSQFQRCFAIKSNLNPLLDIARVIYSELIEEFHDKVIALGEQLRIEHLIPKNSFKRGFHVQVELKNIKGFDVKRLPSICKHIELIKKCVKFTTEDLLVMNYRITQALNQVEMLTNAILFEMLKELRKYIGCIYGLCNSIADLDLIFSFVQYSMRPGRTRPKFGQCINIKNSLHPILEIMDLVIPDTNDIFASTDKNLNIITGPNMGGKSVYIRQVALLQIIAQIGCNVPATEAEFRICDRLFTRIGFGDSIESNASTLVLEIRELNVILPSLTNHSLVIIDEMCRGTSCEEGSSLAWAICEYMMQFCAFIFIATHNIFITKLQDLYCNVVNYHMEALPLIGSTIGLTYTHKLKLGVTGVEDYGLILARDVKMPEHLIDHAVEIGKSLRRTKIALLDNPSNIADLILDNCVQRMLNMKDNECLDVSGIWSAVSEMMDELEENRIKNDNTLMNSIDFDNETFIMSTNTSTLNN